MGKILDRNVENEIASFVAAEVAGEATTEEIIPGLAVAITLLAQELKAAGADYADVIREAQDILEESL